MTGHDHRATARQQGDACDGDVALVRAVLGAADLTLSDEDVRLIASLTSPTATARRFRGIGLGDTDLHVTFDPRWR